MYETFIDAVLLRAEQRKTMMKKTNPTTAHTDNTKAMSSFVLIRLLISHSTFQMGFLFKNHFFFFTQAQAPACVHAAVCERTAYAHRRKWSKWENVEKKIKINKFPVKLWMRALREKQKKWTRLPGGGWRCRRCVRQTKPCLQFFELFLFFR